MVGGCLKSQTLEERLPLALEHNEKRNLLEQIDSGPLFLGQTAVR